MIIKLFLFMYYIINKWLSYFISRFFTYLIFILNSLLISKTAYLVGKQISLANSINIWKKKLDRGRFSWLFCPQIPTNWPANIYIGWPIYWLKKQLNWLLSSFYAQYKWYHTICKKTKKVCIVQWLIKLVELILYKRTYERHYI